jgi:hypothetical protein
VKDLSLLGQAGIDRGHVHHAGISCNHKGLTAVLFLAACRGVICHIGTII